MFIFYLVFLATSIYLLARILGPEMAKPLPKVDPVSKVLPMVKPPKVIPQSSDSSTRIEKLEFLLAEKNKNIGILQTDLKLFLAQVREFDKVKIILQDEITHLKEQNRMFRSELGLPTIVQKEHSNT